MVSLYCQVQCLIFLGQHLRFHINLICSSTNHPLPALSYPSHTKFSFPFLPIISVIPPTYKETPEQRILTGKAIVLLHTCKVQLIYLLSHTIFSASNLDYFRFWVKINNGNSLSNFLSSNIYCRHCCWRQPEENNHESELHNRAQLVWWA